MYLQDVPNTVYKVIGLIALTTFTKQALFALISD